MKKLWLTLILATTIILNPFKVYSAVDLEKVYHDEPIAIQWITDDEGNVYEIGWTWVY